MARVEIYTSPFCGYCHRAKRLLEAKGVAFEEIDVFATPGARDQMVERAHGHHTVPQIFINGVHVGGCDELHELDHHGKLNPLLGEEAPA